MKNQIELQKLNDLNLLQDWITNMALFYNWKKTNTQHIQIILDEIIGNIFLYNSEALNLKINILAEYNTPNLTLTIVDNGKAFNPLTAAQPDLSLNLTEKAIGGLGIHLAKNFSNKLEYQFIQNLNHLTVIKTII